MSSESKIKALRYFSFSSQIAAVCNNCPEFFTCKRYSSDTCVFASLLEDVLNAMYEADEALDKAIKYSEEYPTEPNAK